jgi:hypothetical protein
MEERMSIGPLPMGAATACPLEVTQAVIASLGDEAAARTLAAHHAAVLRIAADLQLPPQQIAGPYCAELARLTRAASVYDYLAVLVAKHIREQLDHAK